VARAHHANTPSHRTRRPYKAPRLDLLVTNTPAQIASKPECAAVRQCAQLDRGPAPPNLYALTGAPGLPGQQGSVDVNVRFANAPQGIEVDTQSTGSVRVPRPEVGYAFGFERLGFA
jgi:hypothetical protein